MKWKSDVISLDTASQQAVKKLGGAYGVISIEVSQNHVNHTHSFAVKFKSQHKYILEFSTELLEYQYLKHCGSANDYLLHLLEEGIKQAHDDLTNQGIDPFNDVGYQTTKKFHPLYHVDPSVGLGGGEADLNSHTFYIKKQGEFKPVGKIENVNIVESPALLPDEWVMKMEGEKVLVKDVFTKSNLADFITKTPKADELKSVEQNLNALQKKYPVPEQIQMATSQQDTLRYQLENRPGLLKRSFYNMPVEAVSKSIAAFKQSHSKKTHPEHDAISFYLYNDAMARVLERVSMDEPLGPYLPICDEYHRILNVKGMRLAYYILIISTRESRHLKSHSNSSLINNLKDKFGYDLVNWILEMPDHAQQAMSRFINSPPAGALLGNYVTVLHEIFYKGSWSSAYGGKNWANVVRPLLHVVNGEWNIEMLLDVGFSLAHNGGPIFNKGMFYETYNGSQLKKILDHQAAGQIPQMIESHSVSTLTHEHKQAQFYLKGVLGDCMGGPVSFSKVKSSNKPKMYPGGKVVSVSAEDALAELIAKELKTHKTIEDHANEIAVTGDPDLVALDNILAQAKKSHEMNVKHFAEESFLKSDVDVQKIIQSEAAKHMANKLDEQLMNAEPGSMWLNTTTNEFVIWDGLSFQSIIQEGQS